MNRIIEIAPGVTLSRPQLAAATPEFGVVRMRREANGQLTPMLRTWKAEVKLTKDLPEQLGVEIDYRTMLRLAAAGFISTRRPSPRLTLVNIASLIEHMDACQDPEFWTPARMKRWNDANTESL